MSIVFFGTPEFAAHCLGHLLVGGERVLAVVTQPDKRRGRGTEVTGSPVKRLALAHGIEALTPLSLREPAFIERLRTLGPEFLVVVAYGRILPPELLAVPTVMPVNLHASLLPRHRGASPIHWAIVSGESETGLCTMRMTPGLDEGDTLLCERHGILPDDTAGTLFDRLAQAGGPLLMATLSGLRRGVLRPQPQIGEPSYAPTMTREDGRVDWGRTARELDCFVRGMQPWPGAFTELHAAPEGGETLVLKLLRAGAQDGLPSSGQPGVIAAIGRDYMDVAAGRGTVLRVYELQPPGKRPMGAGDFARGRRLSPGTRLS